MTPLTPNCGPRAEEDNLLMLVPQSLRLLSAGIVLGALVAVSAVAADASRRAPAKAPVSELRALADHYRSVTWLYQRAARVHRTRTALSYRRSADRDYLRWTIDRWTRRAYVARAHALRSLHRRLHVRLPRAPALRAPLAKRVTYSHRLTVTLRDIYPGRKARSLESAAPRKPRASLRFWQQRGAAALLAVALHAKELADRHAPLPAGLNHAFLCIHRYEGAWTANTGNGYYGGLQMDVAFMRRYGSDFVHRWGTADNWPVWAQLRAALRAHRSGRGFSPWPNTARACGLI
jgi:hypothetical protein